MTEIPQLQTRIKYDHQTALLTNMTFKISFDVMGSDNSSLPRENFI